MEAAFGVDWRNGLARPWADGETTYNTFSESGLSGTATWNGELVGFTPDRAAVHGDASIRVDIAALTGSAAFTTLEHWGNYAPPGGPGTGITWGDGDLHYTIGIDSNYIRSNGGDVGYVSGRFVGREHQGTVGILEHPNLAAGWGASRAQPPETGPTVNGDSGNSLLDKWQRFEAGNPPLRTTGEQILKAAYRVNLEATHEIESERFPTEVFIDEFDEIDGPLDASQLVPVMEHNGVPVDRREVRFTDDEDGEIVDLLSYGGWLDYTIFRTVFSRECDVGDSGCRGTSPVWDFWEVDPEVAGQYSGSTPTGVGSATWTGVMVGMETPEHDSAAGSALLRSGQPDVFLGDARITIDNLAAPDVDVSFANIHNVTEGVRHPDMTWEDLAVEDGLFSGGDSDSFIAGMFTGPQHQEVGGEFHRNGIAGTFGAKRQ